LPERTRQRKQGENHETHYLGCATVCRNIRRSLGRLPRRCPPEPELSRFAPSGALLYLQAKDFSSLLADWEKSQEKEAWLKSKNHDLFSQSRLLLRLQGAGGEFSKATGVPADVDLLRQVAGRQTALALYDIGKLQFLFITRRASADSMQSALWQSRSQFETRTAGGVNFFYRKDTDSDREIAFAIAGDYLLLATREDLMAGALQLLAGGKDHCLEEESWWSRSVAAAGAPGDLRMVLNLEKIVPSPYFRSYWVQQNITDMKQYGAAISDLTRSDKEYHEERTLLRKDAAHDRSEGKGAAVVAEILRLVPANTGIYDAKADPDPKDSIQLLTAKILAPHLGPAAPEKLAPQVQLGGGETGSASDLETRIDQPPAQNSVAGDSSAPLQAVFAKNHVLRAAATPEYGSRFRGSVCSHFIRCRFPGSIRLGGDRGTCRSGGFRSPRIHHRPIGRRMESRFRLQRA